MKTKNIPHCWINFDVS